MCPGTALPEWLNTFRKNFKHTHDAKQVAASHSPPALVLTGTSAADKVLTTKEVQKPSASGELPDALNVEATKEDQQTAASGDVPGALTVEARKEGQQLAASGDVSDASTVEAKKEDQQFAASGDLPYASALESTNEGQQPAASGVVPDASAVEATTEGQQPAAAEQKPVAETTVQANTGMQPGSIVVGSAKKYKEKYDGVKCKVLALLSTQVKVEILEGISKGEVHKYNYDSVTRFEPPAAISGWGAGSSGDAPAASSGSGGDPPAPLPLAPASAVAEPVVTTASTESLDACLLWGDEGF